MNAYKMHESSKTNLNSIYTSFQNPEAQLGGRVPRALLTGNDPFEVSQNRHAQLAPSQDGDLETARVREKRSERPSILKERKKSHKSESNGEAVTFNGNLAHSEKTGMLREEKLQTSLVIHHFSFRSRTRTQGGPE